MVPWFPLLSDEAVGQHLVRSLAEFMDWFDDLLVEDDEEGVLLCFPPTEGRGRAVW